MDLNEAYRLAETADPNEQRHQSGVAEAANVLANVIVELTALCDKPMNDGTPWWVFRDAVRDILEKD